jgi:hypothetical protein
MRILTTVALCLLALAVAATASSSRMRQVSPITANSIGGVKLGLPANAYIETLGTPVKAETGLAGGSFTRLVFAKRKIAVYFSDQADKGLEIVTWNKTDRSKNGIGPCSSIAQLKGTYKARLKPMSANTINGAVYVYHVGNLLFAANGKPPHPTTRVTAIAIYSPALFHDPRAAGYAGFFILSSPNC